MLHINPDLAIGLLARQIRICWRPESSENYSLHQIGLGFDSMRIASTLSDLQVFFHFLDTGKLLFMLLFRWRENMRHFVGVLNVRDRTEQRGWGLRRSTWGSRPNEGWDASCYQHHMFARACSPVFNYGTRGTRGKKGRIHVCAWRSSSVFGGVCVRCSFLLKSKWELYIMCVFWLALFSFLKQMDSKVSTFLLAFGVLAVPINQVCGIGCLDADDVSGFGTWLTEMI